MIQVRNKWENQRNKIRKFPPIVCSLVFGPDNYFRICLNQTIASKMEAVPSSETYKQTLNTVRFNPQHDHYAKPFQKSNRTGMYASAPCVTVTLMVIVGVTVGEG